MCILVECTTVRRSKIDASPMAQNLQDSKHWDYGTTGICMIKTFAMLAPFFPFFFTLLPSLPWTLQSWSDHRRLYLLLGSWRLTLLERAVRLKSSWHVQVLHDQSIHCRLHQILCSNQISSIQLLLLLLILTCVSLWFFTWMLPLDLRSRYQTLGSLRVQGTLESRWYRYHPHQRRLPAINHSLIIHQYATTVKKSSRPFYPVPCHSARFHQGSCQRSAAQHQALPQ